MRPRHLIPALFLLLLIAYPLAAGPAERWCHQRPDYPQYPEWILAIYAPLRVACGHCEPLRKVMHWYEQLWIPDEEISALPPASPN